MTPNETITIENLYHKGKNKFRKSAIILLLIWFFILFVRAAFWNFMKSIVKRRYDQGTENYSAQMYQNLPVAITISIVIALIIFFLLLRKCLPPKKKIQ